MVSFPANSAFSDRLEADAEAVRLDTILPDVLRRYGLTIPDPAAISPPLRREIVPTFTMTTIGSSWMPPPTEAI